MIARALAIIILCALCQSSHSEGLSQSELDAQRAKLKEYFSPDPKKELVKLNHCRRSLSELIGLSLGDVRIKCGRWSKSNVTVTATGKFEQLIFTGSSGGLYIYLVNGMVDGAQKY